MKIFNKNMKVILLLIGMVVFTIPTFATTANAGADQELNVTTTNTTITLDGTASDGTIVKYEWFYNGESIGTGATLDVESVPLGYYTVTLTVTDNLGNRDSDSVNIKVRSNSNLIANAGEDISVTLTPLNSTLTLNGTASRAGSDETIVKYEWFYDGESIGVGATLDVESVPPGYYIVMLIVTDNLGNVDMDTVNVEVLEYNNEPIAYTPEPLPTDMLENEAMNMNPNHPKFDKWINPENIVNGHLELVAQFDDAPYALPRDIWLPHHKYTVVWDMETTGNISEDKFPIVRFSSLGYFSQGYQNSVLNKKETLYTVIVSKDDLNNISYKGFNFSRRDTIPNSTLKISNIRIYDGVIELEKPILKETNFQGTVSMDKEGVFRRNGKVIFPINIYKDNTLITRGVRTINQYLNQGITGTIMEAHSEHWNDAQDDKLSNMIEGGMTTMSVPITNYLQYPTYAVGTNYFNDFSTIMQTLKQNTQLWNGIEALSIDNEFYHKNQQFRDAIEEIRNIIPDKPIQMLNGTEAISAWYNDYIDITGTYIAKDIEVEENHPEATTNIHLMESQRLSPNLHVPVTLLQMNQGTSENFGAILMAGVALGGTKLEYWKDDDELFNGFRNLDMPTLPMWQQLPTLRTYLNKMCDLGIIETTPYIGFKVTQTNDKYEYIKARLGKDNKAYIIASNMTSMDNESSVHFNQTYKGLHYVPSGQLKDIITGEVKGTIDTQNNKISITLAPHTWVVLEVEKK